MSDDKFALPIVTLIETRSRTLGLPPIELVRRAGYKNISKGLRRLDSLREGRLDGNAALIQALPNALQISREVVGSAVEETRRQKKEAEEAAWRAEFKPHAIISTERDIPHPIFVAGILGVTNLLRIDFNLAEAPVTFIGQALVGLNKKFSRWNSNGIIPAFGKATGFVINYAPDQATEYDLTGKPIQTLNKARRLGTASLRI
jgi:hypothetical protein